ncbi:uncharacterized protein LOC107036930 isoform X3 [Diachasma alloeum]|uniref:uncharacterized protein LOC107036930 isoform X3 n=1 Tax=Diachasma alloeum TaxID=454923 RepID=UPI000738145F|nr:uncharacterized protein LOC107036930 isoform X3 [Diachasma alloeum]
MGYTRHHLLRLCVFVSSNRIMQLNFICDRISPSQISAGIDPRSFSLEIEPEESTRYENRTVGGENTERIPVPCSSDCAKGEAPLPDGNVMTMRGCHDMFSELFAHFSLGIMTEGQKAALEGLTSDKIHLF